MPRLWGMLSTLSSLAVTSWLNLLAPDKPGPGISRRATEQEINRNRREVAGPNPSPLERLLAERVALCWVAATYADSQYACKLKAGMSFREGEFLARRCEQSNRQLLKSIESLTRVRKLLTPVQLNVAMKNHVNLSK